MLDLSADAAGDVHLRVYGDARLTDLSVGVAEARIDGGTRGTDFAMEHLGEFEQHVEAFFRAHAITASHHDGRAFQVVLGGLHMVVEDLDDVSLRRDIFRHLGIDHFVFGLAFIDSFLHHARAHRGHLRTMLRIDDGSHDIATESGTNLIEQVVVVLLRLDVVEVADFELGAVGGEAAGQRGADARTEVATDDGGAHQADLRLFLLEEVDEDIGVRG